MTRRRFLITSARAAVDGARRWRRDWTDARRPRPHRPTANRLRVLVIVTLYGGNDGLNTVVPYQDAAYHVARPDFGYSAEQVLGLDDSLGLNPVMKGSSALWTAGRLAVVRGVGYPNRTAATSARWTSGRRRHRPPPGIRVDRPLAGRDRRRPPPGDLARGAAAAAGGRNAAGAALPLAGSTLPAGRWRQGAPRGLGRGPSAEACVGALGRPARGRRLSPRIDASGGDGDAAATTPAGRRAPAQLDVVARCVKAGVPTRVYSVSLGGFDTHADERGTQQRLLRRSTRPFRVPRADGGPTAASGVVLMAYSEFGRRVAANANEGTDHGTAGPVSSRAPR